MDGLLNTCHASLINIQLSPFRKCFPRPSSATMTTRQVESRLIFIDHRSRPRWHLRSPIHAPVPGHGPGPGPGTGRNSIRIRDGAQRFTENIRIRCRDRRLAMDKRTGAGVFFFFLSPTISTLRGLDRFYGIPDAGRFVPSNVICAFDRDRVSSEMCTLLRRAYIW